MTVKKITPLRIVFENSMLQGTGRYNKQEHVPFSPQACKDFNLNYQKIKAQFKIPEILLDIPSTLREYQKEDVDFLSKLKSAGCFNEQRTGKTPTSLTVFKLRKLTKVLIVCPASGIYNWQEEYEKWYGDPCLIATGTKKQRQKIYDQWTHGLVISYDTLKDTAVSQEDLDVILKCKPEGIIVDEIHRIGNRKTAQAKAIFRFKHVPNKLALTGTLIESKAEKIYPVLHFLYPTLFTGYWRTAEYYFDISDRSFFNRHLGRIVNTKDVGDIKRTEELHYFLNNISTQRKRKEVMPWLPEKDKQDIKIPLTALQSRYLQELKDYYETEDIIVKGDLDRLIRYRQICQAPQLLNLKGTSPKIEWIKDYLNDYPDESVLIFSKFSSFLKLLNEELDVPIITGEVPKKTRHKIIKDFQAGKSNVLLLQIDTAKENLTLDKATVIIFADKFPPAGAIAQAEDRFVATNKSKADKKHLIINLIMKDSYDEYLFDYVDKQMDEISIVNDYKKYMKGEL